MRGTEKFHKRVFIVICHLYRRLLRDVETSRQNELASAKAEASNSTELNLKLQLETAKCEELSVSVEQLRRAVGVVEEEKAKIEHSLAEARAQAAANIQTQIQANDEAETLTQQHFLEKWERILSEKEDRERSLEAKLQSIEKDGAIERSRSVELMTELREKLAE